MRNLTLTIIAGLALALTAGAGPVRAEHPTEAPPSTADRIAGLEAQCAATADARAERHAARPLFERLGGDKKIHELLHEVVRLHLQNPAIAGDFDGLDPDHVADRVAEFVIAGTGGPAVYDGPSLTESHARLHLTDDDFLAAGGDVVQAMTNLGYGQDEIDEVVCILVGLRDQVVLPADVDTAAPK